jgi:hypothetical protein
MHEQERASGPVAEEADEVEDTPAPRVTHEPAPIVNSASATTTATGEEVDKW